MSDIAKELLDLKSKIEKAKAKKNKAEGELTGLMKQLEKDFGCKTLDSAKKKLDKMEKDLNKQEAELEIKKDKLINDYKELG